MSQSATKCFDGFDAVIISIVLSSSFNELLDWEVLKVRDGFNSLGDRALGLNIKVFFLDDMGMTLQVKPVLVEWMQIFEIDCDFLTVVQPFFKFVACYQWENNRKCNEMDVFQFDFCAGECWGFGEVFFCFLLYTCGP